jgi:hypothetical protein
MYTSGFRFFFPIVSSPSVGGLIISFLFLFFATGKGYPLFVLLLQMGCCKGIALICLTKSLHVYYYDDLNFALYRIYRRRCSIWVGFVLLESSVCVLYEYAGCGCAIVHFTFVFFSFFLSLVFYFFIILGCTSFSRGFFSFFFFLRFFSHFHGWLYLCSRRNGKGIAIRTVI